MLQAQLIRDTTRQILTNATDAGPRVYGTPILPLRRERPLPALSVYTPTDALVPLGESGPFQFRHHLDLTIEAVTELATDTTQTGDDRLLLDACAPADALIEQVQNALYPNPLWYLPLGFSRVDRATSRREVGSILDTDRRTVAAILTLTLVYDEVFEPDPPDFFYLAYIQVDCIDPFNPNLATIGPDGQIEVTVQVPKSGTLWAIAKGSALARELKRTPGARELTPRPRPPLH